MSLRWTEEEYMEYLERRGKQTARKQPKKQSKYNSRRTWVDGICFDSQKEAEFYQELKLRHEAGDILGFCRQPEFILQEGNAENRAITYSADFIVFNLDGTFRIIDVKGFENQQWKRTYKQFRLKYPKLNLEVVKGVEI